MKLSIVMPTNRASLSARARILEACACGGGDVEIIIHDNSGNPSKREFLSGIQGENCRIIQADPCDAFTNAKEAIALAQGRFIMFFADDDMISRQALGTVVQAIDAVGDDSSVVGITGDYVVEGINSTKIFSYSPFDSGNVINRCRSFIDHRSNFIYYSAVRSNINNNIFTLFDGMPFKFAYSDQVYMLAMLMYGRYININRVIYYYDFSDWQTPVSGTIKDMQPYLDAGLDPSALLLHHLFAAFEGCKIAGCRLIGQGLSDQDREAIIRMWYARCHSIFAQPPYPYDKVLKLESRPEIDRVARHLRDKWTYKRDVSFDELLTDLTAFISLTNPAGAILYRDFWQVL